MAAGTADAAKAFNTAWEASTLNTTFSDLWSASSDEYPVLNDQEAIGNQPFPYVVMDPMASVTTDRMSGDTDSIREIRDVEIRLTIHARERSGDSRSAKEIAAYLAEEIMKVFGGHPTVTPTASMSLDNGNYLLMTFQNDFGLRTGDDEYSWVIVYNARLDVPVMA